jgi:NADPH-dependent ferric siderophore reductase
MPGLSSFLSNTIEKLLFHPVTVIQTEGFGGHFQLVRMQGEGFSGVSWTPGQAVQFFLGNLTRRAYTPMNVDAVAGAASFLFHLHGGGPGSGWAAALKPGDRRQVMRPKDSLDFSTIQTDAIFFGDDTSLAAAQALQGCHPKTLGRWSVLEVVSADAAQAVAQKLALDRLALIQKEPNDAHLNKIVAKLAEHSAALQSPQWVFTGQARSIQTLRKNLKARGIELARSKVRPYWASGKTGMD